MSTTGIRLIYNLTESAQRAELAAGRPAHARRTLDIAPTPELAALATIAADGAATLDYTQPTSINNDGDRSRWSTYELVSHACDRVLSGGDAIDWIREREAAVAAKCDEVKAAAARRAEQVAHDEAAAAAANAARRAAQMARLLRVESGDLAITGTDTTPVYWIDTEEGRVDRNAVPEATDRIAAAAAKYQAKQDAAAAAARAARIAERDAWIREHGSQRLRLGLDLGQIDQMAGVYLSERRDLELPGWRPAGANPASNDRLNPTEAELVALAEARKIDPAAELISYCADCEDEDESCDEHTWIACVRIPPRPWGGKRDLILHVE